MTGALRYLYKPDPLQLLLITQPGHLTIVDLSCPCVTPENACSLFNICLSLFVEQSSAGGRIVALDEAHKVRNEA